MVVNWLEHITLIIIAIVPVQRTPAMSGQFLNGRSVPLVDVPLMSGHVTNAEKSIIFRLYLPFKADFQICCQVLSPKYKIKEYV